MVKIIRTNTTWRGQVTLTDDVQVAGGVTLTIAAGARINGEDHSVSVAGRLNAAGSASSKVELTDLHLDFLSAVGERQVSVDHVLMTRGSFLESSGGGTLRITNSIFDHTSEFQSSMRVYIEGDSTISGNIFYHSSGLRVSQSSTGDLSITNNVFYDQQGNYALQVEPEDFYGATYSVFGNSFLSTDRVALASRYEAFDASNNWFGGGSPNRMTFDGRDDLTLPVIDISPWLTRAAAGTPSAGTLGNDIVRGTASQDLLFGLRGNDVLRGLAHNDREYGHAGNDRLYGEAGNDTLNGGLGKDFLVGGAGRDTFVFTARADSLNGANRDVISDFQHRTDKLAISTDDGFLNFTAREGAAMQTGMVTWDNIGSRTMVYADTNFDGRTDFQIELIGNITLTRADFLI